MAESGRVRGVLRACADPRLGKLCSLVLGYPGGWLDYFLVALGTQTLCHSDLHFGRLDMKIQDDRMSAISLSLREGAGREKRRPKVLD